jgi:polygalacturonase
MNSNKRKGDRAVFNIRNYGAAGDGKHDDRPALEKALAAARKEGGVVLIPKNTTLGETDASE